MRAPSPRVSCCVDDIPTIPQGEVIEHTSSSASTTPQASPSRSCTSSYKIPGIVPEFPTLQDTTINVNDPMQQQSSPPRPEVFSSYRLPPIQTTATAVNRSTNSFRGGVANSYMRRRLEYMNRPDDDPDVPPAFREPKYQIGSIAALPIDMQVGFRRKMLSIFAMQLLLLTGLMALLTYEPSLSNLIESGFQQPIAIIAPLVIMIGTLALVYVVRAKFPLNWIMVLLFSAVLSVFLAALQVWITTNAALFCCGFTFLNVCIMVPLSGLKRQRRLRTPQAVASIDPGSHPHHPSRPSRVATSVSDPAQQRPTETVLRSSTFAGAIGFIITGGVAGAIFGVVGDKFVTAETFGYSLLFELVLVTWFAYDANSMYNVMTPDEYMNGVIYFYMDLIALVALTLVFGGVLVACTALGPGAGIGYCDFYGCCLLRGRRPEDDPEANEEGVGESNGTENGASVMPQRGHDDSNQW